MGKGEAGWRDGELAEEEPRAERRAGRAGPGEPQFDSGRRRRRRRREAAEPRGRGWRWRQPQKRRREGPALPGPAPAGPHHGQRRLQAQLQEGGDPAHHQDAGEGRHLGRGARGPRHFGSRGGCSRPARPGRLLFAGPGLHSRPALGRLHGEAVPEGRWGSGQTHHRVIGVWRGPGSSSELAGACHRRW